jgi:DNA-binding transcriptional ArsR family regulator
MGETMNDEACRMLLQEIKESISRDERELDDASKIFKLLANPTRLRIAFLLNKGEVCTRDIGDSLGKERTLISHHLKPFKDLDLINERREGRWRYHSLKDERIKKIFNVIGIIKTQ